jgi:hypothetical protein
MRQFLYGSNKQVAVNMHRLTAVILFNNRITLVMGEEDLVFDFDTEARAQEVYLGLVSSQYVEGTVL